MKRVKITKKVHSTGALKPCGKATGWHKRRYIRNKVLPSPGFSCDPNVEGFAVGEFIFGSV